MTHEGMIEEQIIVADEDETEEDHHCGRGVKEEILVSNKDWQKADWLTSLQRDGRQQDE